MLKKAFRSALSLLLVFCLLLGLSANGLIVLAEELNSSEQNGEKPLIYVSIGDSMTNGYGLDGYDGESGIMNYGINTYANQFAAWLAGYEGEIADDQTVFVGADGTTVDHRQLAMSGLRAEDLAWLLQLDYTGESYDFANLVHFKNDLWNYSWDGKSYRGFEYEWDGGREYWYSYDVTEPTEVINGYGFRAGDWRTWTDLLDYDYRLADGAAKIVSMYSKNGFVSDAIKITDTMISDTTNGINADKYYPTNETQSNQIGGSYGAWLQIAAEFYQDSVKDADVITLALGNTNFGTFMFDTIKDIFLNPTAKNWFPSRYHIDEVYLMAKGVLSEDMLEAVEKMIDDQINPILDEQFGDLVNESLPETVVDGSAVDPYDLLESRTKGALIKYIVKYCVLSYVVSYVDSVERIVELNGDVDLIQIALMNAYKTEGATEVDGLDFATIIDMIYTPMNAFLAALPSYLAQQNPEKYADANFYYADCGTVETLSAVFGNDYYTYGGEAITYNAYQQMLAEGTLDVNKLDHNDSTVRERFHHWLASSNGCYQDRNHAGGAKNCTYCKGYLTYYYLWLEMGYDRSVGKGTSWGWCDVTSYGEMWKGLLGPLECDFPDGLTTKPSETSEYLDEYNEWLTAKNADSDMGDTSLIKKFFNQYRLTYVTEADIIWFENMGREAQNTLLNGAHSYERDKAFSCAMYLAFEDATIRAGKKAFVIDDLTSVSGLGYATFDGAVELFAEKMGLTGNSIVGTESAVGTIDAYNLIKNFSDALVEDGPSATMLCLANRMQIGTGIGGHPSEGGHDTMAKAIIKAYDEKQTSEDGLKDVLKSYLEQNYPNLYEMMFGSENMGDMDDLAIIVTMLKMSDSAALEGVDLDALEADIRASLREFENAKTAEESAAAQDAAYAMYRELIALATAATGVNYEVTEESFYVSLGDSNVNGYGLEGYIENMQNGVGQVVAGSAPVLLAQQLYGENWKDHFGQYAQGALRSEDMLYILGDESIVPDAYYYAEIEPNLLMDDINTTRDAYKEALRKADLISVAIGGGNVTTFVGHQVDLVLDGQDPVPMDWAKIGYTDEALTELTELLDTMVPLMDAMGMMDQYLPEGVTLENCGAAEFGRVLLESLLYGYASYNYYYPMVLDRIREINPNAQLLILGMFNPVDDWTMEMDGQIINIGGIVANVMEMANLQNLAYALQNANTSFIDLSDNITFLDADVAAGTVVPTFQVYYESILEGNGKEVHANADGHEYMFNQMLTALSGEGCGEELEALMAELYAVLQDDYLTTQEKLELLADLYEAIKDSNDLGRYPEVAVLEEIHAYLYDNKYLSDEQTLDIVMYTYERMLDRILSDEEKREVGVYVYETLLLNKELSDEDRIAIIGNVYAILDAHYDLSTKVDMLEMLENICAELMEKEYVSPMQAFAIVHLVYLAAADGTVTTEEYRLIANLIYYVIFGPSVSTYRMARSGGGIDWSTFDYDSFVGGDGDLADLVEELKAAVGTESTLSPVEKVEVLIIVYNEVKNSDAVDMEENEQVAAVAELFEAITGAGEEEALLTPEQTVQVMQTAFENLVAPNPEDIDYQHAAAEIAQVVTETLIDMEPEKAEQLISKIEETVGAITGTESGGEGNTGNTGSATETMDLASMTKYLKVVKAVLHELEIAGYLTKDEAKEMISIVYPIIKGEGFDAAEVIDHVYGIVFGDPDLSLEDKIQIVVIVYNTLVAHELIEDLIDIPTTGEAEDYFVDLGGKVWEILDGNWAELIVELENNLETLYGELEAETLKLNDELYKLVELQKAELNKLIAERDELNKKLDALKADLEAARNGGVGTYSVNTVQSKESELIEELKAAIAETEAAIDALDAAIAALTDKIAEDLQGVAAIEAAIEQIKAEIADTETALNEVLAVIDQLNADLKDVYDATLVLNAALENLYGMTLGQVDGKAVLEAVNTIIDTVPAIVENLELVYNKTQVAIEQVEAAIDTFNTFADNIQTNVDNIIAGVDELAGLTAEQLEAIKNAAAECQMLVKDFVDTNLPKVETALEETYAELEKLANEEIAKAKLWYENNQTTLLIGAGAIALVVMPYVEEYVIFKYEDGKLSYTLTEKGQDLVNKYTGILNEYLDELRAARDEAQQWWDENYPKALDELNTKLDDLRTELENLDIKFENPLDDEYQAAKKAIEDEIKRLEALRDDLIEEGKKVEAYLNKVEGAISEVESALNGVINAGHVVDGDLKALWNALTNLHGELVDLHDAVVDLHDATVEELFEIFNLCGIVADEFANVLNTLPAYVDVLVNAVELITSVDTWHKLDEVLQNAVKDLADRLVEFLTEEETQQLIKDLIAQYGPVVAEQLLEALVYLFEEYGHDVAVAFYNYLYNNPDEVIAFFNEYGDEIVELAKEYGDEALGVIAYALYLYGEDLATYLVENHETILANLAYWWNIHDEKMIDLLQVYAEALGLCDAVRDEITKLENAIESLEKELNDKVAEIEKELADLYEQLETATGAAKEAIEAKIAALEAELAALKAEVEAKIAEVKAAIEALKAELENAINTGLTNLEAVKDALLNLDEKVAELIEVAKKAALDEVNNAIANIEKAIEKLDEALYQLLGEVYEEMKDVLNELLLDLVDELADAACKYFPEVDKAIYDYLYNNPDEVIAFFQEYGYILRDLIEEYGDEVLGIIAYALYMYGEELADYLIENYDTILEGLLAWVEEYGERVAAMLQVYAEALGLCDAVRDQIADLEAKLEELKAELENATEEVKAAIEAEIAKIEAAIEELKEKLEALEKAISNAIVDLNKTVEEIIDEVENLVEEIEALVEKIEQTVAEMKAMVETAIDEAVANLEAAVETLKSEAKNLVAELKAYVDALVYDALHADYEIDNESEYVALGDGAYAELLGQYLTELVASQNPGYTYSFTDLSVAGSMINDLGAMIEANMDVIANADLISIGYGNETFAEAAIYELFNALAYGTVSTYDWVALVGPEAAAEIEKMLADVYAELVAQGMDITVLSEVTMATAVTAALECYAYNVVTYVLYLPEAINAIHAINPDALVVVVGMSNPFRGTTFAFGESAIVFDEYVDYLVHAANVECVTYAILNENTVYVPVADAESTLTNVTMDFNDPFYLMNLLAQIIEGTWGIEITEAGNEYIVEQIKNALTITVKSCHMLGDVNCDGIVDVEDAMLILQLEALLIDTTGLDVNVADVSGDGLIDVEDAMLILQYEAEIIEKFPAEG